MGKELPDFDALVALYQQDPQAFEDFRRQVLRDAVDHAPRCHQPSLNSLLDKIEEARDLAQSPFEAAAIASRMMRDSAERLLDAWEDVQEATAGLQAAVLIERVRACRAA